MYSRFALSPCRFFFCFVPTFFYNTRDPCLFIHFYFYLFFLSSFFDLRAPKQRPESLKRLRDGHADGTCSHRRTGFEIRYRITII